MKKLECVFSKNTIPYTGVELRPHFVLNEFSLKGDAIAGFIGPCSVKTDALVDWEDRAVNSFIEAKEMIHFIGEFFGTSLVEIVTLQRLFIASTAEVIRSMCPGKLVREGDDLYVLEGDQRKKLSVSIVTSSPVSQLFHLGINIDSEGAPVAATGLKNLGIDPNELVPRLLEQFSEEYGQIQWACAKVRPVM